MVFHGFWLVSMVFQGGFMVFHGLWLVSMVFQGIFMAFHGFWLVSMVFQGSFMVLCHEGQLDHPVSTFSFAPKEVVQMFSPEMHPGPTILGPPPVGRHRI